MINQFLNLLLLVEKNQISDLPKLLNAILSLLNPKILNDILSLPKFLNKILSLPKLLKEILGLLKFLNVLRDLGLQKSIWDYPPGREEARTRELSTGFIIDEFNLMKKRMVQFGMPSIER
ncbi:hypothetical protein PVK06_031885 [Gossypium arboreum]|uniref:Uncharacterized protein n=1 Tax=Gossypium arboreum TaxID=29729 RepID=A0ABR0NTC6_GOSAR|nr:hypothetical protein PVK06_031885 [Gossypium arboreum]